MKEPDANDFLYFSFINNNSIAIHQSNQIKFAFKSVGIINFSSKSPPILKPCFQTTLQLTLSCLITNQW